MPLLTTTLTSVLRRQWFWPDTTYKAQSTPSPNNQSLTSSTKQLSGLAVFQHIVLILLLAYPIIAYYDSIVKNAYNFPYEDDLNSALSFIADYTSSQLPVWDKIKLIFSQYNEHRIVFDRLVFLLDYTLFGQVNFKHLILIGNLAPLLIGFLFYKIPFQTQSFTQKLFYLVPVAYTLFSFQYWELATWSMAALQNLFVLVFAMTSLYSLCQPGRTAFFVACLAALIATYTSGNGLFTFIAGIAQLLVLQSYRRLMVWVTVGIIAVGLYFVGYMRPPYHPDIADSLFNHTGRAISYFFTLIGSMVGPGRPKLALLFGVVSLFVTVGLVGYLWYQKRLVAQLPLVGWLAFLVLTCLSLMASRSGMGIDQAYTPRYGIVAVLLFATQAVLVLETIPHRSIRWAVWSIYALTSVFFYFAATNQSNRHRLDDRNRQMRYNSALYHENPADVSLHWGNQAIARSIFTDAIHRGIYQVPALSFQDLASQPTRFDAAKLIDTHTATSEVKPYVSANFLVIYRAWALLNQDSPLKMTVQLIAKSSDDSYAFDTQKHIWDDTGDYTLGRKYTRPGFSCVIDKNRLPPGHYVLWLCLTNGETKAYQSLDVTFDR